MSHALDATEIWAGSLFTLHLFCAAVKPFRNHSTSEQLSTIQNPKCLVYEPHCIQILSVFIFSCTLWARWITWESWQSWAVEWPSFPAIQWCPRWSWRARSTSAPARSWPSRRCCRTTVQSFIDQKIKSFMLTRPEKISLFQVIYVTEGRLRW